MLKIIIFISVLIILLLLVKYFYCDNEEYFADVAPTDNSSQPTDTNTPTDSSQPATNTPTDSSQPDTNTQPADTSQTTDSQKPIENPTPESEGINPTNTTNPDVPVVAEPEFKSGNPELDKFLGSNKTINLITKFNGKEYILLSVKTTSCKGVKQENECLNNMLIIMEYKEYQRYNTNSKYAFKDELDLCNYKNKLKCQKEKREKVFLNNPESEMTDELENTIEGECHNIPNSCSAEYQNSGDFHLIPVKNYKKDALSKKLYKLIGKIPLNNTFSKLSMSVVPGINNVNKICLDGSFLPDSNQNSSFELLEVPQKDSVEPYFIIRFITNVMLKGNYPLNDANGNPIVKTRYAGICKDEKCNLDGVDKYRLCLYESEANPFVLTFTPVISKSKID